VADGYRTEHDSLGEVRVPSDALWGPQTQRAIDNFPISGTPLPAALIRSLALIKAAAARVNGRLGVISDQQAMAIERAAERIVDGEFADQFPVDVFQTGSGTSTNMNVNEVIATLATRRQPDVAVHPNDHVNASQSSNDTFPTAIHIAAAQAVRSELIPALLRLHQALADKAVEFAGMVKAGRTHLMDATPITLGQEFGGYAATVRLAIDRLESVMPRLVAVPLGGTAVGTGINMPAGFAAEVLAMINAHTGLDVREADDHFEAQGTRDSLVELSGVLRTIAVGLTKIANDLRWLSSGPTAGLAEIHLPDLQPGSLIMPGKVNPVIPEATLMVCAQVIGNDATITVAGAAGNFELNVMMPVLAANLLSSIQLLTNATTLLNERCVRGIVPNPQRMRRYAESSPSIATALNRSIGYERAAAVVKRALTDGTTIRDAVIGLGLVADGTLTEADLDRLLDVDSMT